LLPNSFVFRRSIREHKRLDNPLWSKLGYVLEKGKKKKGGGKTHKKYTNSFVF
jgi:hypothetical protein